MVEGRFGIRIGPDEFEAPVGSYVFSGRRCRALIGLAVRFETWQALTAEEGLSSDDAATVMARAVDAVVTAKGPRTG